MVDNIDKKIDAVVGEALDEAIEKEEPLPQWIVITVVVFLTGCGFWYLKKKSV